MAGFNDFMTKLATPNERSGISLVDALAAIGRTWARDPDAMKDLSELGQSRLEAARQRKLREDGQAFMQSVVGGDLPQLGARPGDGMEKPGTPPIKPPEVGERVSPQAMNGQEFKQSMASTPRMAATRADKIRMIQSGIAAGLINPQVATFMLESIKATDPKYMEVNGTILDGLQPGLSGTQIPELNPGQFRTVGPDGLPQIANVPGFVAAEAQREGAVAGAKAAGESPYEFVQVPTPSGAPSVVSRSRAAGREFVGQSPADAIREQAEARGEADRANALQAKASVAASQLATLDNMEGLLPDVIAGFGADQRLGVARAMALAGNDDAKRQVAATETYLNEARNLVADIIRSFGANPTEGERKYAERMSGADANLNPETLREGIRLRRERINRDLTAVGRSAQSGGGASQAQPAGARSGAAPATSGAGYTIVGVRRGQ